MGPRKNIYSNHHRPAEKAHTHTYLHKKSLHASHCSCSFLCGFLSLWFLSFLVFPFRWFCFVCRLSGAWLPVGKWNHKYIKKIILFLLCKMLFIVIFLCVDFGFSLPLHTVAQEPAQHRGRVVLLGDFWPPALAIQFSSIFTRPLFRLHTHSHTRTHSRPWNNVMKKIKPRNRHFALSIIENGKSTSVVNNLILFRPIPTSE
jgi:hypothetical protein